MANALICSKCGYMSSYGDDDVWDKFWERHIKESMPIACNRCGIGEMKLMHKIDPAKWCDKCCLPRIKCTCGSKAWTEI